MAFAAQHLDLFEKYFPSDKYQAHYQAGHEEIAAKIKEKVPALKKILGVSTRHLDTIDEITSAMMIMGVTQAQPDVFGSAVTRLQVISLLVDTWKGTNETGAQVIENAIHEYVEDFPEWADVVNTRSSYYRLILSVEPRGAQVVKYRAHESITSKTSSKHFTTLVKTSLVPKLHLLGVARVDPKTETIGVVIARGPLCDCGMWTA